VLGELAADLNKLLDGRNEVYAVRLINDSP